MNWMKILCLLIVSIAMADVHPGLKNAIDKGDYKTAKTLIEKFSIKDVYCPSSLDVSEGVALFGQEFRENPDVIFQKCSPEFIRNFGKNACISKDNIKLCKSYMIRSSLPDLENYYSQILESGWHKEENFFRYVNVEHIINSLHSVYDYEIEQFTRNENKINYCSSSVYDDNHVLWADFPRSGRKYWSRSSVDNDDHILWELMVADKKIVAATNQPWLKRGCVRIPKDLYVKHQRLVVEVGGENKDKILRLFDWTTDSLAVESLMKIYAEKSMFPDTSILGACRRNGKIDEIFENTTGLNLFSCAKIIKKYDDHCNTGDKTVKVVDGVEHRLICETNHWRDVSEEDDAVYEVFPYICNRERAGNIVDAFVGDDYYQFICDGSKWSNFSVSVKTGDFDFVWMIKNSSKKPEYTDCGDYGRNDKRECSTCINGEKDCGEQGRYYHMREGRYARSIQSFSDFCPQGWKLPPEARELEWYLSGESREEGETIDTNQVKKLQLKNMLRRTRDGAIGCFWAVHSNGEGLMAIEINDYGNVKFRNGNGSEGWCAIRCVKEKPKELSNPIPTKGVTPAKKEEAGKPEKPKELSNPIPTEDVSAVKKEEAIKSEKAKVKLRSTLENCDDPNMRPVDRKRCKVRNK